MCQWEDGERPIVAWKRRITKWVSEYVKWITSRRGALGLHHPSTWFFSPEALGSVVFPVQSVSGNISVETISSMAILRGTRGRRTLVSDNYLVLATFSEWTVVCVTYIADLLHILKQNKKYDAAIIRPISLYDIQTYRILNSYHFFFFIYFWNSIELCYLKILLLSQRTAAVSATQKDHSRWKSRLWVVKKKKSKFPDWVHASSAQLETPTVI